MKIENGYYKVKFYNHEEIKLMFYNGKHFELFRGDTGINDEIESYEKLNVQASQLEPPVRLPKRELLEKLEFAQKELDMLYHFAISNGIAEAGKPPHKVIADYIKQIK